MYEATFIDKDLGKDWAEEGWEEGEEARQELLPAADCMACTGYRELLITLGCLEPYKCHNYKEMISCDSVCNLINNSESRVVLIYPVDRGAESGGLYAIMHYNTVKDTAGCVNPAVGREAEGHKLYAILYCGTARQ